MHRHIALLVLIGILVAGCATSVDATPTPVADPAPPAHRRRRLGPRPIVIDADMDHSDLAAILVLLRDPAVDVLAIAIDGTGLVHCQGGLLVTRYLLEQLGRTDIPYGCGRQNGGDDARPFPDDWRATADAGYGLPIEPRVETEFPPEAADLIRKAVDSRPARSRS